MFSCQAPTAQTPQSTGSAITSAATHCVAIHEGARLPAPLTHLLAPHQVPSLGPALSCMSDLTSDRT